MSKPPHPWTNGYLFQSPGSQFTYRVIGPCCRLFDREQLPWPCCRIQWHGKEPSWRRVGRRFIADLATQRYPSYCVELIGTHETGQPFVVTCYIDKLSGDDRNWWYSKIVPTHAEPTTIQADQALSPNSDRPVVPVKGLTDHQTKPDNL